MLLLTDRFVRRPDLLAGGGLAALVALEFLTGHAESSFHAMLAAVLFCPAAAVAGAPGGRPARDLLGRCSGSARRSRVVSRWRP